MNKTIAQLPTDPQRSQHDQSGWLHGLIVLFGFALLFTLLFLPIFCSDQIFAGGDNIAYYLPAFYARRELWTNLIFSGYPIAADSQNMTWYPPALLLSLIDANHHNIIWWNIFVVMAYALAGSFTYGYIYTITRSPLAATVAGIIFSMSGYMVGHSGIIGMVHTAAWMPLLIWALEKLRHQITAHWQVIGSFALANCVLGGHPQIALYGISLGCLYALILGRSATVGYRSYYRSSLLVLVLGCGLCAIQLLPTIELSQLSARAELTFERFITGDLAIWQGLQFGYPFLALGATSYIYVGVVSLPLAWLGSRFGADRAIRRFWLFVVVGSLILIFSRDLAIGAMVYAIPIYNKFRLPNRHCLELAWAISILAGLGIHAVQQRRVTPAQIRQTTLGAIVLTGFSVISLGLIQQYRPTAHGTTIDLSRLDLRPWTNPAVGHPLIIFGSGLIGLVLWYRWQRRPQVWIGNIIILGTLLFDGYSFSHTYYEAISHFAAPQTQLTPSPAVIAYQDRLTATHQRLLVDRGAENWTTPNLIAGKLRFMPQAIFPNLNRLWQLPIANGYSPLILTRLIEMMSLEPIYGSLKPTPSEHIADRSLDLMAVKYRLSPTSRKLPSPHWQWREHLNNGDLYENQRALPRCWLVSETIAIKPSEVLTAIQTGRLADGRIYEPRKIALVEHPGAPQQTVAPLATTDMAQIQKLEETQIIIQTQTAIPTFLVLADVFYPGWQATIDGRSVPIVPTNYVQRGVQLPAGQHQVQFEFRPLSFRIGQSITAMTIAYCLYRLLSLSPSGWGDRVKRQ
jgi:Bacterial membrane protein YfhO